MSTYAMAAIINEAVRRIAPDTAFVNIGVWHGFTFLSGLIGNGDKHCIGIDNFSEYGGPKEAFYKRFEKYSSSSHDFYEMDYIDYFATLHETPIGFFIYDGNHSYENQCQALTLAEPFFADDCIIMVDDTNYEAVRRANEDFIKHSPHNYEILFDQPTYCNHHPTFWNGVTIIRRVAD
ncbi:MAG: class I SAM-dependent methyltransferase [Anaerolineae bacterium]|nr:class I SAM-dependent methyltransferase [Anaerolineae bacterium]